MPTVSIKVMRALDKNTGHINDIRVTQKKQILERNEIEPTKSEKNILQTLSHPFLLTVKEVIQTADKLYVITEPTDGDLFSFVQKQGKKLTASRYPFQMLFAN